MSKYSQTIDTFLNLAFNPVKGSLKTVTLYQFESSVTGGSSLAKEAVKRW